MRFESVVIRKAQVDYFMLDHMRSALRASDRLLGSNARSGDDTIPSAWMDATQLHKIEEAQKALCTRHGAAFVSTPPYDKMAIATATMELNPINGLRHPQTDRTSGWYVWCGELFSESADFFEPLHAIHI